MKLLVIDIQNGITDERLYNFDNFIRNVSKLIDTARKNSVEVIYFQHDDGPGTGFSIGDEEFEIAKQVYPEDGEKCFVKTVNSCFGNHEFAEYLKNSGEGALMMVGLQTNFCVDATVKSAFDAGYRIYVPGGANSTFDNAYMNSETTYRYYNEMLWPERFAKCISMDEALELLSE